MKRNGKDRLDHIEELLRMAAAQTVATHRELREYAKRHDQEMTEMRAERRRDQAERRRDRAEHKAEMKEIRAAIKSLIVRIAV